MPYRDAAGPEPYSLRDLDPSYYASCATLLWELVCRDPSTTAVLNEVLTDVGADEAFGRALDAARRMREQDPPRWPRELARHIAEVDDPQAQALIFMFLYDVASVGLLNQSEQALCEELRAAWTLPPSCSPPATGKPFAQLSADEQVARIKMVRGEDVSDEELELIREMMAQGDKLS